MKKQEFFSDYTIPGTSYVYDEAAGTGVTIGWVAVNTLYRMSVSVKIDIGSSTSIEVRIEGKVNGQITQIGDVLSYDANQDPGALVQITTPIEELRVGVKGTALGGTPKADIYMIGR